MQKKPKHKIAIFFTILFMALLCAPTIILSFDSSVDVSSFYNINEEEENENLKLVFKDVLDDSENFFITHTGFSIVTYTFKTYSKPYINLIIPPPEFV
jgi:hypothetical protein